MLELLAQPMGTSWAIVLAIFCAGVCVGYWLARWEHQYFVWESWLQWFQGLSGFALQVWLQPPLHQGLQASAWHAVPLSALLGIVASRRRFALAQ